MLVLEIAKAQLLLLHLSFITVPGLICLPGTSDDDSGIKVLYIGLKIMKWEHPESKWTVNPMMTRFLRGQTGEARYSRMEPWYKGCFKEPEDGEG